MYLQTSQLNKNLGIASIVGRYARFHQVRVHADNRCRQTNRQMPDTDHMQRWNGESKDIKQGCFYGSISCVLLGRSNDAI